MKLVEGQLEYLLFIRDFSEQNTVATQILRDFINSVELIQKIQPDVMPRWIMIEPMIEADGTISGDWAHPGDRTGRIVRGIG